MKAEKLFQHAFWDAFNTMMRVETFPPQHKLRLVKFKRYLSEEYQDMRETSEGMQGEQLKELINNTIINIDEYKDLLDIDKLAEHLTAAQLFELSAITNKE